MIGRAEANEQKRAVIERLYRCWLEVPALRLGQLLCNVFGDKDTFYVEDEAFIETIENFLFKQESEMWQRASMEDFLKFESEDE
jgi:hypothetical protein